MLFFFYCNNKSILKINNSKFSQPLFPILTLLRYIIIHYIPWTSRTRHPSSKSTTTASKNVPLPLPRALETRRPPQTLQLPLNLAPPLQSLLNHHQRLNPNHPGHPRTQSTRTNQVRGDPHRRVPVPDAPNHLYHKYPPCS